MNNDNETRREQAQDSPVETSDVSPPPAKPAESPPQEATAKATADREQGPNPFDLTAVKRKAATLIAVKKTLNIRVCKKIDKTTWFQVCPHSIYHFEGYLLDPGENAEGLFWISPFVLEEIDDTAIRLYELHLCQSKNGNSLFFWAIGLPNENGRDMECDRIRREYAQTRGEWMRMEWNEAAGMHDQSISLANWPDPEWPDEPVENLIRVAFRGRVIESVDHPVILQLKGLA